MTMYGARRRQTAGWGVRAGLLQARQAQVLFDEEEAAAAASSASSYRS